LTQKLIDQGYTPLGIYQQSERFFVSLGLSKMTDKFWQKSMFVKPAGKRVQCHAAAFDMFMRDDFRIKMCTTVNEENFYVVHHEMGHISYYQAYKDQPNLLRNGANSGFHEAIGDTVALSVSSNRHLEKIGLIDNEDMTREQNINYLMEIALKKIAILPFAYVMDKWRWSVFRGHIDSTNYNQKWWELREKYTGIESPVKRSEVNFDAGAKFHIPSFTPYVRYFLADVLQFQFLDALCNLADQGNEPLHKCDFYANKQAGLKLKSMLELGASQHWSVALRDLTGQSKPCAKSILKYFEPLAKWLNDENAKYPDDMPGF
jgi:hypothetical protein